MIKVILDTDIGNDVDDSYALGFLLNHPKIDLLGITTVSGEAAYRKEIAQEFVRLSGKSVSVFEGASKPLIGDILQPKCFQALQGKDAKDFPNDNPLEAIHFLASSILKHPNEIIICAIGPLTNLALLAQLYPETTTLIKEVVIMGYKTSKSLDDIHVLDWNVHCDRTAAQRVVLESYSKVTIVPCDVTYQLHSKKEVMDTNLKGRYGSLIKQLSQGWFKKYDGFSYHDPLTALYITNPELFEIEQGLLYHVESNSPLLTEYNWHTTKHHHYLIQSVDQKKALQVIYETLNC